ncbi:hypothetical protein JCM10207_001629 [Rhodosporidiobolus poonsookiae]
MPRRHSGSLVPKYLHDPALLKLMRSQLTNAMVSAIAEKTVESVKCRPPPSPMPTPPLTPGSEPQPGDPLPPLEHFIKSIVRKSKCHVPTLLCTLVYLDRLKERLPGHARGCYTTRHRVFLATLIVAAKYLNDSSPQNKHWVRYSVYFTPAEVNLMERQLLTIFNFDLRFTEDELLYHLQPLLNPGGAPAAASKPAEAFYPSVLAPVPTPASPPHVSAIPLHPPKPHASSPARELSPPATPPDAEAEEIEMQPLRPRQQEETALERHLRLDRRQDEVVARRPYRPLMYDDAPPSPYLADKPRHVASSRGPLGEYARQDPAPVLPLFAGRPVLRPGQSYSSMTSSNSRGSRPPSWGTDSSQSRSPSPRSSDELARASPGNRTSRLSSHSSTSTLSSAASSYGPRTPSPPLPLPYHHHGDGQGKPKGASVSPGLRSVDLSSTSSPSPSPRASSVPLIPALPTLARLTQHHPLPVSHKRDPSYAPPSPSLIHAMAHDPDLWPLMSSSATYARRERERFVKGEMRVVDAGKRARQGRLGLNLRAGERREGVYVGP